jgi:hypothetical protein
MFHIAGLLIAFVFGLLYLVVEQLKKIGWSIALVCGLFYLVVALLIGGCIDMMWTNLRTALGYPDRDEPHKRRSRPRKEPLYTYRRRGRIQTIR